MNVKTTAQCLASLLALSVGCATQVVSQPSMPPYESLVHYGKQLGFAPISEDTTQTAELELELLPAHAVVAHWMGRAPTPELVLIFNSGRWRATLGDKNLLPGWEAAVEPSLELDEERLSRLSREPDAALRLATDLSALLVDPDPSLGRVVSTVAEIPLHHPLSDFRADLERQDLTLEQIERRLLANSPAHIEAPTLRRVADGRLELKFTTWSLHGGRLEGWRVGLGQGPYVRVETLAEEIGSFRYFFY